MNKARCVACNVILVSKHRHDFCMCPGGHIFVDGGDAYWRCGYDIPENFIRIYDDGREVNMVEEIREYNKQIEERMKAQEEIESTPSVDSLLEDSIETLKAKIRRLEEENEALRQSENKGN